MRDLANQRSYDVIILGAGIIGLATALELAKRHRRVGVLDTGTAFAGASSAAGGMLVPWAEMHETNALQELSIASLKSYPDFVRELAQFSDVTLRMNGILETAATQSDIDRLAKRAQQLASLGVSARILKRDEIVEHEPMLTSNLLGALLTRAGGCIANRDLGHALKAACKAHGVSVAERIESPELLHDGKRVLGVRVAGMRRSCETVINATGAWAARVSGVPDSCSAKVYPVRGQLITLRTVNRAELQRVTWSNGIYGVPRGDGYVDIGATSEDVGFDARTTRDGVTGLLASATAAFPTLRESSCVRAWVGLRPATKDGWPLLGATPLNGYVLATGHYRHGILLAPITAKLLVDAITNHDFTKLAPFSLDRLGRTTAPETVC